MSSISSSKWVPWLLSEKHLSIDRKIKMLQAFMISNRHDIPSSLLLDPDTIELWKDAENNVNAGDIIFDILSDLSVEEKYNDVQVDLDELLARELAKAEISEDATIHENNPEFQERLSIKQQKWIEADVKRRVVLIKEGDKTVVQIDVEDGKCSSVVVRIR